MRRRRTRRLTLPSQNLDSFLDILTNTVGVLMFISLFITLISIEVSDIIHTPLVAKTDKQPYFLEVRNNKITPIEDREINRQVDQFMNALPTCPLPQIPETFSADIYQYYLQELQVYEACRKQILIRLKGFRGETDHYRVRFIDANALIYEPFDDDSGEDIEELSLTDSDFQRLLDNLSQRNNYLAFVVRPNSFPAFRAARKLAAKRGFDVGWEPQETNVPIVFGSGGRAVGVQ